jgi:hypothetical protein
MGRRRKAGRAEDPREVDTIEVDWGEDARIGARGVDVVTKVVGTLDDHDSNRHMHCFEQIAKNELRS